MSKKITFTEEDRIAIIAPHPDDECMYAAGVLLLASDRTDIFVLTDGSHGNKEHSIEGGYKAFGKRRDHTRNRLYPLYQDFSSLDRKPASGSQSGGSNVHKRDPEPGLSRRMLQRRNF